MLNVSGPSAAQTTTMQPSTRLGRLLWSMCLGPAGWSEARTADRVIDVGIDSHAWLMFLGRAVSRCLQYSGVSVKLAGEISNVHQGVLCVPKRQQGCARVHSVFETRCGWKHSAVRRERGKTRSRAERTDGDASDGKRD